MVIYISALLETKNSGDGKYIHEDERFLSSQNTLIIHVGCSKCAVFLIIQMYDSYRIFIMWCLVVDWNSIIVWFIYRLMIPFLRFFILDLCIVICTFVLKKKQFKRIFFLNVSLEISCILRVDQNKFIKSSN